MDRAFTRDPETGKYTCDICGAGPLGKSGYYKHHKTAHDSDTMEGEEVASTSASGSPHEDDPVSDDTPSTSSPSWLDFVVEGDDKPTTDRLPTPLKIVAVKGSAVAGKVKLSKKEQEMLDETNLNLLKIGLTGFDVLVSKYGRVIQEDPEWEVNHSDKDKTLVASAQYEYLKTKGVNPSEFVGPGSVALALTGWYITPPILRAHKGAKKSLLKGGFLRRALLRVPILGKRLKKRGLAKAQKLSVGPVDGE